MLPDVPASADLILTSPPYVGVTNYRADNWLRLWALGEGPARPNWTTDQKFSNAVKYQSMLSDVMRATRARSRQDAIWCLRVKGGAIIYRRGGCERSGVALQNRTTRRLP